MDKQSDSESDTMQTSSATSSRTFRIPLHSENILSMLNKQRETGEYCDVTVLVDHQRFSAHKCVLAANSPYLQTLMSRGNDGVLLRQISPESFKSIIDFMYTSRLQLLAVTVQDVLNAARLLQIRSVVSICCRYLESQLTHIAKDVTTGKRGKQNYVDLKPIAVSAVNSKYQSPQHVGQPLSNSTMLHPPQPSYNDMGYAATPSNYTGRNSAIPHYLPQEYSKLPPTKPMMKRYDYPQPQVQPYRPYQRPTAFADQKTSNQVQNYTPRYDRGQETRNEFFTPQQQWSNAYHPRINQSVSDNYKKSSTAGNDRNSVRINASEPKTSGLPRVSSSRSLFTVEPEDRYFHKKYGSDSRRKSDNEPVAIREFKNNLSQDPYSSNKAESPFLNVSYY